MIDFKRRIEIAHDNVGPDKLIFNGKVKWLNRSLLILWVGLPLALFIFVLTRPNSDWHFGWFSVFFFSWFLFCTLCIHILGNRAAKGKLKDLNIEPPNGLLKHWATTEYFEYKCQQFLNNLYEQKILTNSVLDIELIVQYSSLFKEESRSLLKNSRLIKGTVFLAFTIPAWDKLMDVIFQITEANVTRALGVFGLLLLLLVALSIFWGLVQSAFDDHANKQSSKYHAIATDLATIKMNLEVYYKTTEGREG
jgi:hypothetical protein